MPPIKSWNEFKAQYALNTLRVWEIMYVAGGRNTPISIIEALSKDERHQIRESVAANASTPMRILQTLSKDRNIHVKNMAYHCITGRT